MITYDEINVQILGLRELSHDDQRDVRRSCMSFGDDLRSYIEDELIPEHLKNKVKVVVK